MVDDLDGCSSLELDRSLWILASHSFHSSFRLLPVSDSKSILSTSTWLIDLEERLARDLRIMMILCRSSSSTLSVIVILRLLTNSFCVKYGSLSCALRYWRRLLQRTTMTATRAATVIAVPMTTNSIHTQEEFVDEGLELDVVESGELLLLSCSRIDGML
jgi:hypothetical protein